MRKQKGCRRKAAKRLRAKHCCGCSILSWEQKFDKFQEINFSDFIHETDCEEHWIVPPVCNGGGLNARGEHLCVMIAFTIVCPDLQAVSNDLTVSTYSVGDAVLCGNLKKSQF
jgi:hypothetical protein